MNKATTKINIELAEEARRLHREGATSVSLATKYGMSAACMRDVLHERMHRRLVTVELSSDQWARLNRLAARAGKPREEAAFDMLSGLLSE